ncbi:RING-type domain-containing protein [Entamoeba marina]
MDIEKILPSITCPICLSPIQECCVTACGHAFCKGCLDSALSFKKQCPYCNSALQPHDYYRFYQFDHLLNIILPTQHVPIEEINSTEHKETNENLQMVSIKHIVNGATLTEKNELLKLPCNLEHVLHQENVGETTFTLTSSSSVFPFEQTKRIDPYTITVNTKIEEPKLCLRYRFTKNMQETFYECKTCGIKFVCSTCAEVCHKGHDLQPQLTITCANGLCYCSRSKVQCKLTLK